MITWPLSPTPPPPIARRSTPRAASSSARIAIAPGTFLSCTTNWLAIARIVARRKPAVARVRSMRLTATAADLPPDVAAALANPAAGERGEVDVGGTIWPTLSWGNPAAPPVLLVHGVTSNAGIWWRGGPAIAAAGHRVP